MVIIYSDTAFSLLIQPIAVVGYLFGMFFFLLSLSFLRLEHRLQSSLQITLALIRPTPFPSPPLRQSLIRGLTCKETCLERL